MRELAEAGIRLHTFGFKTTALIDTAHHIASSDSMAWSTQAYHSPPMPGHRHRRCVSCPAYALHWYDELLRRPVRQTSATGTGVSASQSTEHSHLWC
ncbi:hypothetical protein JOF53_006575 [Crossiella equi]|uniref:DeoxyPurine in DNA protein A domain-containing protein n=1 Tax=Crossiella equi TaxID=130796 RepID=A0ABS5AMA1_9PSEU|nr:hypothetical protein [Crossiella equi]MBP2477703.1 hypothetical protein [Crossiella equi]